MAENIKFKEEKTTFRSVCRVLTIIVLYEYVLANLGNLTIVLTIFISIISQFVVINIRSYRILFVTSAVKNT